MNKTISLGKHLARFCKIFALDDKAVPSMLFTVKNDAPCFCDKDFILPVKKDKINGMLALGNVTWLCSTQGLIRLDKAPKDKINACLYFSADRDLKDNNVKAVTGNENDVWVLTETGASHIELKEITGEEKADILLDETLKYVDRRGMVSQKALAVPGDVTSAVSYGHSDNDGSFTGGFVMGELFRYAVYKKEKGENDPKTIEARKVATRAAEAMLLLLNVSRRGDGFAARTYLLKDEPLPDDGIFFRICGNKAICQDTSAARERGCVGYEVDASHPIPERLRHLFTDVGGDEEGLIYKADTSSDEISHHMLFLYFAHEILGDDKELDEIIISSTGNLMNHIIDNGFVLADYSGESTTWAKWNEAYFATEDGYVDACLNSAELLMYLKVTMAVSGEEGKWKETYDYLINEKGYADLTEKHFDRMYQLSMANDTDFFEEIMYGDHMLATLSFWGLCMLEKDETLLKKYRNGYKSWMSSIREEFNPGYNFPFLVSCPGETADFDRMRDWFIRNNTSRLAASVSFVGRHDVAVKTLRGGYQQSSHVFEPDEIYISKYDRDTLEYKNEDSNGLKCVESCYVYTFAYWTGRYYGFIESED